jgi:pimeloyl-ACP methyl ester carboxylesterase
MWEPQVLALQERHHVVRFDVRGLGGSAPGDGPLTMERIALDAVALLDHLGISQAVVCGLSMGGYAAFAMWRLAPDRVRALVLADTRAAADSESARNDRALLAEKVRRLGPEPAAEAFLPRLLGQTTRRERPDLVSRVRDMILSNPARGLSDALAGLAARADSTPTLREIRVPTLFIAGEEDAVSPPEEMEGMARQVAGSRFVKLPRAGHLSNLETPEAFNGALQGFLGQFS